MVQDNKLRGGARRVECQDLFDHKFTRQDAPCHIENMNGNSFENNDENQPPTIRIEVLWLTADFHHFFRENFH